MPKRPPTKTTPRPPVYTLQGVRTPQQPAAAAALAPALALMGAAGSRPTAMTKREGNKRGGRGR